MTTPKTFLERIGPKIPKRPHRRGFTDGAYDVGGDFRFAGSFKIGLHGAIINGIVFFVG
jgi:hypothetical protein